ncbi:hypothetical protein D3C80_1563750 [compost metagenome]
MPISSGQPSNSDGDSSLNSRVSISKRSASSNAPALKPVVDTAVTRERLNLCLLPMSCSIHEAGAGPSDGRSRHSMSHLKSIVPTLPSTIMSSSAPGLPLAVLLSIRGVIVQSGGSRKLSMYVTTFSNCLPSFFFFAMGHSPTGDVISSEYTCWVAERSIVFIWVGSRAHAPCIQRRFKIRMH